MLEMVGACRLREAEDAYSKDAVRLFIRRTGGPWLPKSSSEVRIARWDVGPGTAC